VELTIREIIADIIMTLFMLVGVILLGIGAFGADTALNDNLKDIGDIIFTGTLIVALFIEQRRLAKARKEYRKQK
jgi:hypothetical membrane protein